MKKLLVATIAFSMLATTAQAKVWYPPKVPVIVGNGTTSAAAGVAATSGFLAFVAALALYDIQRRWTCSGDYLGLGGPGFNEPWNASMAIKPPPNCGQQMRRVVRTRG